MISDPFDDPRLLIADGRDDTHRLNVAVKEFVKNTIYSKTAEFDSKTSAHINTVQFGEPLPINLPVLARKAIGSFRSALDHAIYASAQVLGIPNSNSGAFPFGDTIADFEGDIKRKCRNIRPELVALLRGFKPYQGGNETLWTLNKLRNLHEHRLLISPHLSGALTYDLIIAGKKLRGVMTAPRDRTSWNPMNNELRFDTLNWIPRAFNRDRPERDDNVRTAYFITFGEIDCVRGKPVVPTLYEFARIVEGCVMGIEAETRRIAGE